MKICAVSDVHVTEFGHFTLQTPEADVLTVSGDLTMRGNISELIKFRGWLAQQPQKYKVVIAGNHDFCLQNRDRQAAELILGGDGITYLRDQITEIEGFKFYGSPWQPWFHDWAFNLQRGPEIAERWSHIPEKVDVLLVHGPPHGYGDRTVSGERAGCEDLLKEIEKKSPRVVCYGHIHEDTGVWKFKDTVLANVSVGYRIGRRDTAARDPFVYELTRDGIKY